MNEPTSDKYRVPVGLRTLLEAIARETLRTQPTDLINFSQLFIETLQRHRQQNPGADILNEPMLYECFKSELQQKYREESKDSDHKQHSPSPLNEAATKIQAAFRGHMVRANPKKFGVTETEVNLLRRRSNENLRVLDTSKDLKRHSIGGYNLESSTPADRAATKIQAEIRGFLARRHVQQMKKEGDEAAKKIQAHIRGYLTRKHLDEAGIQRKHSASQVVDKVKRFLCSIDEQIEK